MKTNLPASINTVAEAKAFLKELHSKGEAYHCEDDAHEQEPWHGMPDGEPRPTPEQCDQLNKLMEDIYNLPGNDGRHVPPMVFEPCMYVLQINSCASLRANLGATCFIDEDSIRNFICDVDVTSFTQITGIDMETEEGTQVFLHQFAGCTINEIIEKVEHNFGSDKKLFDIPAPLSFTEQLGAVEKLATAFIVEKVKETLTLHNEGISEGLLDMPDFETFDNGASEGYSNIVEIGPDKNHPEYLLVTGINKKDGLTKYAHLHELDAYGLCALADYLKETLKK